MLDNSTELVDPLVEFIFITCGNSAAVCSAIDQRDGDRQPVSAAVLGVGDTPDGVPGEITTATIATKGDALGIGDPR